MFKHQIMKEYEGVEVKLHELLTSALEINAQLYVPAILLQEKQPPEATGQEAGSLQDWS
jgi:hypothetical protein